MPSPRCRVASIAPAESFQRSPTALCTRSFLLAETLNPFLFLLLVHATDSPRTVRAPSYSIEYDGSRALRPPQLRCAALHCTGTARFSTAHDDASGTRVATPAAARSPGPGSRVFRTYFAPATGNTIWVRRVGGPTRRPGTPAPVASGIKVEGEHTGAEGPCLFELVVRARPGRRALDHVHLSPSTDAQVQGICTDEEARYRVRRNALMLRWAWVIHVDRVCHACVCDKFIPTRNCGLYCLATSIHESYFFLASECSSRILVPSSVGVKETEVTTDTDAAAIQDSCQNK